MTKPLKRLCFAVIFLFFNAMAGNGQVLLNRNISLQVNQQRLDNVLEIISNKGNFYFSYNSSIIKKDSLISLTVSNTSIASILKNLFNGTYEFKESGNYIIIRKAPIRINMNTEKAVVSDKFYSIAGNVYDGLSGEGIESASIYEKDILASAFTNANGYFKIKIKSGKKSFAKLTVSKEFYEDAIVSLETKQNQEITVTLMPLEQENNTTISPQDYIGTEAAKAADTLPLSEKNDTESFVPKVEKLGFSKFFLSAKQKIQSANLKKFFTSRPFQVSLTPKLGSHGYLSAQVVNNFSLNVLGGYTAGTNGVEIGGLFNIDKKNVQYVQVAGLFNKVGGTVKGFQVGGLNNTVLDTVKGFQAAGINNFVKGKMSGFQVSGIYNHVTDRMNGFEAAGISNFVRKEVKGMQIAGIANINIEETRGVQVAGIVNYTRKLKGLQIGLINISDSSSGYSIGLINIVRHGYHKLNISTNEVVDVNFAFKSGNPRFYSILTGGLGLRNDKKLYAFGYGVGSEITLNKRKTFSVNPELISQALYIGSWNYYNLLNKLSLEFNIKINKKLSVFTGPSFNVYVSDQKSAYPGYRFPVPAEGYHTFNLRKDVNGWFGWNAGINLF